MIKSIHNDASTIKGWLSKSEGALLYRLAQSVQGNIVEIGSYEGRSTLYLARAKQISGSGRVIAIDTFKGSSEHRKFGDIDTYDSFMSNMQRMRTADVIDVKRGYSYDIADDFNEDIDMLFIDGSHEYEHVKRDFIMWAPKVRENGIIAFHDMIDWHGPAAVFREYILNNRDYTVGGRAHSLMFAYKRQSSTCEFIKGKCIYAGRTVYESIYRIKKAFL